MRNFDAITVKAAYSHIVTEGAIHLKSSSTNGFVKLGDLQELLARKLTKKEKAKVRGWSFTGDWQKSVAPYYNAA